MRSNSKADKSEKNHKMLQDMKQKKNKKNQQQLHNTVPQLLETDEKLNRVHEEIKKKRSAGKEKRKRGKDNCVDVGNTGQMTIAGDNGFNRVKDKLTKANGEKKKKKKIENENKVDDMIEDTEIEDGVNKQNDDRATNPDQPDTLRKIESSKELRETDSGTEIRTRKSKKSGRNKNHALANEGRKVLDSNREVEPDEVYRISSGDEDCSKGMKKWIMEYHQSRPGLKILQERIDDFISAHEEKLEQERIEREARVAEGGFTVVVHHKGRKKTTDSESGVAVGSVAQAAVEHKLAKKKSTEVGQDFYRFQKREAQRNEIISLQSKFEQDKKRIQQLRAARKFRPY